MTNNIDHGLVKDGHEMEKVTVIVAYSGSIKIENVLLNRNRLLLWAVQI
jgi:hypothetical protein